MNATESLHTAIRRYCIDRSVYWTEIYSRLDSSGNGFSFENGYSREALATFPRYNVLNAILMELERYQPTGFSSFEEARDFFLLIARDAQSIFTQSSKGEIEIQVMKEERELLTSFIAELTRTDLTKIEPLFYRRVLSKTESEQIRERLKTSWNVNKGYWYPLTTGKRIDVEAFQDSYFEKEFGFELLQRILENRGITRVWEIGEDRNDYEIEVSIFEPLYNGAERLWCDKDFDWLIYASHESSITIGGWLLNEVKGSRSGIFS